MRAVVAEGRVLRDVLDALAVDPDLAPVVEAFEEFLAGVRQQRYSIANGIRHSALPAFPQRHLAAAQSIRTSISQIAGRRVLSFGVYLPCGRGRQKKPVEQPPHGLMTDTGQPFRAAIGPPAAL